MDRFEEGSSGDGMNVMLALLQFLLIEVDCGNNVVVLAMPWRMLVSLP